MLHTPNISIKDTHFNFEIKFVMYFDTIPSIQITSEAVFTFINWYHNCQKCFSLLDSGRRVRDGLWACTERFRPNLKSKKETQLKLLISPYDDERLRAFESQHSTKKLKPTTEANY